MRRNAFGRQVDSFEADLDVDGLDGGPFHAVFIRAPVVERAGDGVEVLAAVDDHPVLCRQGRVLVSSFHPELTDDRAAAPAASSSDGRKGPDVRPFQVGHDQAQEGRGGQGKRGKLFAKLIRQVEVAAREGGGDPDTNPTLRTMFQKARDASVPLDTIERAIKRGTGELEGVTYEQITYEGYAPGRRRRAHRGAHRQPQPHRRRHAQPVHQARRLDGRARRGGVAVRAQGRRVLVDRPPTRTS